MVETMLVISRLSEYRRTANITVFDSSFFLNMVRVDAPVDQQLIAAAKNP